MALPVDGVHGPEQQIASDERLLIVIIVSPRTARLEVDQMALLGRRGYVTRHEDR
jgi:hypothetical protein